MARDPSVFWEFEILLWEKSIQKACTFSPLSSSSSPTTALSDTFDKQIDSLPTLRQPSQFGDCKPTSFSVCLSDLTNACPFGIFYEKFWFHGTKGRQRRRRRVHGWLAHTAAQQFSVRSRTLSDTFPVPVHVDKCIKMPLLLNKIDWTVNKECGWDF